MVLGSLWIPHPLAVGSEGSLVLVHTVLLEHLQQPLGQVTEIDPVGNHSLGCRCERLSSCASTQGPFTATVSLPVLSPRGSRWGNVSEVGGSHCYMLGS